MGEMAILSERPRSADCVAITDITALRIDRDTFWELLAERPPLALGVIKVLVRRLDEATQRLSSPSSPAAASYAGAQAPVGTNDQPPGRIGAT